MPSNENFYYEDENDHAYVDTNVEQYQNSKPLYRPAGVDISGNDENPTGGVLDGDKRSEKLFMALIVVSIVIFLIGVVFLFI